MSMGREEMDTADVGPSSPPNQLTCACRGDGWFDAGCVFHGLLSPIEWEDSIDHRVKEVCKGNVRWG